jgi:hypothetical protein
MTARRRSATTFTVTFRENRHRLVMRKLADVDVHFTGGDFDGLNLPGFAVWVGPQGSGESVTFSSRAFSVLGGRRSFSLLRWVAKREARDRMADVVHRAYRRQRTACPSPTPE